MNTTAYRIFTIILTLMVFGLVLLLIIQAASRDIVPVIVTEAPLTPEEVVPEVSELLPVPVPVVPPVGGAVSGAPVVEPVPVYGTQLPEVAPEFPPEPPAETPPPAAFPATYISSVIWPPEITRTPTTATDCTRGAISPSDRLSDVTDRTIAGVKYCIRTIKDGAAGSLYTQYQYSTVIESQLIVASFTLRFPNCGNYDESQQSVCLSEQGSVAIDGMVHAYVQAGR